MAASLERMSRITVMANRGSTHTAHEQARAALKSFTGATKTESSAIVFLAQTWISNSGRYNLNYFLCKIVIQPL